MNSTVLPAACSKTMFQLLQLTPVILAFTISNNLTCTHLSNNNNNKIMLASDCCHCFNQHRIEFNICNAKLMMMTDWITAVCEENYGIVPAIHASDRDRK